MPFAGTDYVVFRNVKDPKYGAKGDGRTDDFRAIQKAITDGKRCGAGCSATSTKGAIIYFPPGTYAISQPLVQYYYTTFIGDPNNRAVIKGLPRFRGIALIDTDFYIEGGNGTNWYSAAFASLEPAFWLTVKRWINQNNFYRQVRNLIIDMRDMPNRVTKGPRVGYEVISRTTSEL